MVNFVQQQIMFYSVTKYLMSQLYKWHKDANEIKPFIYVSSMPCLPRWCLWKVRLGKNLPQHPDNQLWHPPGMCARPSAPPHQRASPDTPVTPAVCRQQSSASSGVVTSLHAGQSLNSWPSEAVRSRWNWTCWKWWTSGGAPNAPTTILNRTGPAGMGVQHMLKQTPMDSQDCIDLNRFIRIETKACCIHCTLYTCTSTLTSCI